MQIKLISLIKNGKTVTLILFILIIILFTTAYLSSNRSSDMRGRASEQTECCVVEKGILLEEIESSAYPTRIDSTHTCAIVKDARCDINDDGTYVGVENETRKLILYRVHHSSNTPSSCLLCTYGRTVRTYAYTGPIRQLCMLPGERIACPLDGSVALPPSSPTPFPDYCLECDTDNTGYYDDLDKAVMLRCIPEKSHCPRSDVTNDGIVDQRDVDASYKCQSDLSSFAYCYRINFDTYGTVSKEEADMLNLCFDKQNNKCTLRDPNNDGWLDEKDIAFCDKYCYKPTDPTPQIHPSITPSPTPISLSVRTVSLNTAPYINKKIKVHGKIASERMGKDGNRLRLYLVSESGVNSEHDLLDIYYQNSPLSCLINSYGDYECGMLIPGKTVVIEGTLNTQSRISRYVSENGRIRTIEFTLPYLNLSSGLCAPDEQYSTNPYGSRPVSCIAPYPRPTYAPYFFPKRTCDNELECPQTRCNEENMCKLYDCKSSVCTYRMVTPTPIYIGTASSPKPSLTLIPTDPSAKMPNPASIYCLEQGYQLEIRGSTGFCIFNDGSECIDWLYYRGECSPKTHTPTPMITQKRIITPYPTPFSRDERIAHRKKRADVNQDNSITLVDFEQIRKKWGQRDEKFDINEDGIINALDIALVITFIKEEFH